MKKHFTLFTLLLTTPSISVLAIDLIVYNAKITTLDTLHPTATAVAVKDGIFIKVGSNDEILKLKKKGTRVIDAINRRMLPGLNDSHLHATRGGRFYNLELRWDGVKSLKQGLAMIKEQAKRTPEDQWVRIIGGWSQYQFKEKRMPTMDELNQAAPDTPLFVLYLYSQGFLNKAGLEKLGIDKNSKAPSGSEYVRDKNGIPTGLLIAKPNPTILYQTIAGLPQMTAQQQVNSTKHFYRNLASLGLTSTIDAGGGGHDFPENYQATKILAGNSEMPLRISYYLFPQKPGNELPDFERWISNNRSGQNGDRLRPNGYTLKGGGEFLVWSAGDYENFMSPRPDLKPAYEEELTNVTILLLKSKWPLRIHATYDESITKTLNVFEAINKRYPFKNIRWAFDHGETVQEENLTRVRALGGGIAIQNRMAYAGEAFIKRYGANKAKHSPPIRKMLDLKIPVGAGTDGTRVSSYNPWVSLYWMVSGKTIGGTQLYDKDNRLSRLEALELFTTGSAWFSGEEKLKGRIIKGQYADFILTSKDYMEIAEEHIKELHSVLTVVGGKIEWGGEEYKDLINPLPRAIPEWSPTNYFNLE